MTVRVSVCGTFVVWNGRCERSLFFVVKREIRLIMASSSPQARLEAAGVRIAAAEARVSAAEQMAEKLERLALDAEKRAADARARAAEVRSAVEEARSALEEEDEAAVERALEPKRSYGCSIVGHTQGQYSVQIHAASASPISGSEVASPAVTQRKSRPVPHPPKPFSMVTRAPPRRRPKAQREQHEVRSKDGKLNLRSMYVAEATINRLLGSF